MAKDGKKFRKSIDEESTRDSEENESPHEQQRVSHDDDDVEAVANDGGSYMPTNDTKTNGQGSGPHDTVQPTTTQDDMFVKNIEVAAKDPQFMEKSSDDPFSNNDAPPPLQLTRATSSEIASLRFLQFPGAYSVEGLNDPDAVPEQQQETLTSSSMEQQDTPVFSAEVVPPTPPPQARTTTPENQDPHQQHLLVDGERVSEEQCGKDRFQSLSLIGIAVMATVVLILALGLSGVFRGSTSDADESGASAGDDMGSSMNDVPTVESLSTLEKVKERGRLRAGMTVFPALVNEDGEVDGRDASLVRKLKLS